MSANEFQASVTALAVGLAVLGAFALHLDAPWWAAISAWIVGNPERGAVLNKGVARVIGTAAGGFLGYVAAYVTLGMPLLQIPVIALSLSAAAYLRYRSEHAYMWLMLLVMISLSVLNAMTTPEETLDFVFFRSTEIMLGVTAATIAAISLDAWRPATSAPDTAAGHGTVPRKAALFVALFSGFTTLLILLIWQQLALPSSMQILISLIATAMPTFAMTQAQIAKRLAGCVLGGAAGLMLTGLSLEVLTVWLALFFVGIYALAYVHHGGGAYSYVGTQGGIGFIMATVSGTGPTETIIPVFDRIAGISIAMVLMVCLIYAASPWLSSAYAGHQAPAS
ncbi:MAG: FUSC family protein [Pseudomonadota bacterium]